MGLAASQARGILLEAKISDVEFEAQQINQARARLSDESAAYMNQLLNMEVPVAPSKAEFTTMHYAFNQNGKDYTITNIGSVDKDGNATVKTRTKGYGATVQPMTGENSTVSVTAEPTTVSTGNIIMTKDLEQLYKDSGYKSVKVATAYDPNAVYMDKEGNNVDLKDDAQNLILSGQFLDENGCILTTYQTPMYDNSGVEKYQKDAWDEEIKDPETGEVIEIKHHDPVSYEPKRYERESDTPVSAEDFFTLMGVGAVYQEVPEAEAEYFIGDQAQEETNYKINGQSPIELDDLSKDSQEYQRLYTAITQTGKDPDDYYIVPDGSGFYNLVLKTDVQDGDNEATLHNIQDTNDALIEEEATYNLQFDTNGRVSAIIGSDGTKIALEPIKIVDEDAYNDAMSNYEYEKNLYNQEQAEINAQMSIIQQQDKKLELKLTQLDTERQELTTELEAVEKVMGENVDRTYKTFNG